MMYDIPTLMNSTEFEFYNSTGIHLQFAEKYVDAQIFLLQMQGFSLVLFSVAFLSVCLGICFYLLNKMNEKKEEITDEDSREPNEVHVSDSGSD